MAGVLQTSQPLGERFTLPASNSPGNVDVIIVDPASGPAGVVQPFRARYFVDPAFVGVQTGSASNPFTTIAAAFAFATLLGQTSGLITVPNGATITENVVMPTSGFWEIAAPNTKSFVQPAVLSGTITITTAGSTYHAFTGLALTGIVSGNCSAQTRVEFTNTRLTQPLALTALGGASLRCIFTSDGVGPSGVNGFTVAVTLVGGAIVARGYRFGGLVTIGADSEFNTCRLDVGLAASSAGLVTARLIDIDGPNGVSFTAPAGTMNVAMGAATTANLMLSVPVVGAGVTLTPLAGNTTLRQVAANNLAFVGLMNGYPPALVTVDATLTLLVPGTAGAAQMQLSYVDLLGAPQVKALGGPLNIAAAAGTEVSASLSISQNGSGVTIGVAGIVTPGALSYSLGANARVGR